MNRNIFLDLRYFDININLKELPSGLLFYYVLKSNMILLNKLKGSLLYGSFSYKNVRNKELFSDRLSSQRYLMNISLIIICTLEYSLEAKHWSKTKFAGSASILKFFIS